MEDYRVLTMLGPVAGRSMNAAAAEHLNLRALAAGNEESQMVTEQQLKELAKNQQV